MLKSNITVSILFQKYLLSQFYRNVSFLMSLDPLPSRIHNFNLLILMSFFLYHIDFVFIQNPHCGCSLYLYKIISYKFLRFLSLRPHSLPVVFSLQAVTNDVSVYLLLIFITWYTITKCKKSHISILYLHPHRYSLSFIGHCFADSRVLTIIL